MGKTKDLFLAEQERQALKVKQEIPAYILEQLTNHFNLKKPKKPNGKK